MENYMAPTPDKKMTFSYLRIFHPGNTIEITQAGLILRRRFRKHARAVSSPAALLCIRGSGDINIQAFR
jgi:hypothetical protein